VHKDAPNPSERVLEELAAQVTEQVRRSGIVRCDLEELDALRARAKARIFAIAARPFDEAIASDRLLADDLRTAQRVIETAASKCSVLEVRLANAREQTARLPEPKPSQSAIAFSASALFTTCFAPTFYTTFMSGIQDPPLAWLIALALGAAVGAFLVQVLLQQRGDAGNGKQFRMLGFGLGFGFGLLRLSKAEGLEDWLVALGLTILECAAVVGLDWYAEKRRQLTAAYQHSRAQVSALEQAVADLKSNIHGERVRSQQLQSNLRQREAQAFDAEQMAEQAAWTVEAAYRSAVHANQRLLEGGAGFALA
jgi:hypothetical protein